MNSDPPRARDDFKWFGEGFSGFPKILPEDTVEYIIHIVSDAYMTDAQIRSRCTAFLAAANALSKQLLKHYIWQRETFALEIVRDDGRWFLRGRTNYGDSVADEWLVVYLLRETSRMFPEAWIRIYDTDGEFLLIEAANALPKWLNPEVAENRVWMHDRKLRIIPLASPPRAGAPASKTLSLKDALLSISSKTSSLIHSPLIEEEAFYRLRDYPSQISQNLHNALVALPRNLAYILHTIPHSISPAIESFYLRDPISLRPLQSHDSASLTFAPTDLVTISARFTKVGYAQLRSQEFPAPPVWGSVVPKSGDSKMLAQVEMGMKLACGFEMLLADPQNQDKRSVREIKLLLEDVADGEETLPSDAEITDWKSREDDESWLDINFEDFERELAGKRGPAAASPAAGAGAGSGFGDKTAQENLRKMVQRFEDFLNDDDAGPDGAEGWDDMDYDEDEDEHDSDGSSEGEDKDVSFDEEEFARMMREMMGMPAEPGTGSKPANSAANDEPRIEEIESDDEDEDANEINEIQKLSQMMEAELRSAGALNLDAPETATAKNSKKPIEGKSKAVEAEDGLNDDESDDGVAVDFNLAKNMLESLKGQAGMAGPAGNLMGLMGVNMPRDDDDRKKD